MLNTLWLAQTGGLSPAQRAVRDHFQQGGSFSGTVIVVSVLLIALVLLYLAGRREQRNRRQSAEAPQRLFLSVVLQLPLERRQRQALLSLARDLRLANPTTILLSREMFDQAVVDWLQFHAAARRTSERAHLRELLAQCRAVLFVSSKGQRVTAEVLRSTAQPVMSAES